MFYPGERRELAQTLHAMLAAVPARAVSAPKAIIVPHAGYAYSGAVAASAVAMI